MKKKSNAVRFIAIAWKEGGHYVSQCLNVDVASFGKTKQEALQNLEEALLLYFKDLPRKMPKIEVPTIEVRKLQYA